MHILDALQNLVDYVLLVHFLQNAGSDDCMQIGLHVLKHQVNISIIFCLVHVGQLYYILMVQFIQKHDLSEGSLCVGGVLKCIEYFFQSHRSILAPLIEGLPYDSVGSLTDSSDDFIPFQNLGLDVFGHLI